ncbi:MAG TPA: CAP domain-containing protein [Candidatus Limnocylindrales bacterium]|nr:CAP domain-containing protein [Candidatus Limnocylindrales bacterium]
MNLHRPIRSASARGRFRLSLPLSALVAVMVLAANPGLVAAWTDLTFSSTDESTIVTDTNQARASAGVASLTVDSVLHSIAEDRAKYMYMNNCLTHNSCTGGASPMYLALLNSDGYCLSNTASPNAGENIAWNNYPDDQTTSQVFNWWMNSATHKANILQSSYTRIGVGAFKGDGRWGNMADRGYGGQADSTTYPAHIFVQVFAHPCGSSPTPTPKPTPTPTPKPTPTATPRPTPTPTPRPTPTPGGSATPRPTPTATPRPTPTPTPGSSSGPTDTPTPADTPSDVPSDSPTDSGLTSPDATFDATTDPRFSQGGGSAVWTEWNLEIQPVYTPNPDGPFPFVTPEPTPTPEPTAPPDVSNGPDTGLAVVEPVPDHNLLDAIVGGVVSSYFNP